MGIFPDIFKILRYVLVSVHETVCTIVQGHLKGTATVDKSHVH